MAHRRPGEKPISKNKRIKSKVKTEVNNELGVNIFPSALEEVLDFCLKARQRRVIENTRDVAVCSTTFIFEGAEQAASEGKGTITVNHINKAWEAINPGGTCPPYKCMQTSILKRVSIFEDKYSKFDELNEALFEIIVEA